MRFLILNWRDPRHPEAGGAERYVSAIAHLWRDAGHDVTVFTSRLRGHPRREQIDRITYVRYGSRATTFHWARLFLRRRGPSYDRVVECVSTRPYFAHRIVGARATALYMQIADDVWDGEFVRPLAWVGRNLLEPSWLRRMQSSKTVAISYSTAEDLARFGVRATGIVPPGCDLPPPRQLRSPGRPPRLLFIGRLVRTKRPDDAVAAFELISAKCPGATLDIVGDGYFRARLASMRCKGVTVHGALSEAHKSSLLDAADLVLIPGTREGWGIVAMEAAAHGIPVVAYDIPGLRDSVVDGVTGVLIPATPEAMAQSAVDLLGDHQRWRELSEAARARSQDYSWPIAARRLLEFVVEASCPDSSAAA